MSSGQPLLTSLHGMLVSSVAFTTVCSTIIFLYAFHFFMSSCYESSERVISISHKCWKHGKIKGTKAPLHPSTSEMALSIPKRLEHAATHALLDPFSSPPATAT